MKKGFVFMETIIVLTIVSLSLTMLLTSFSLLTRKSTANEYYDNISDKYLLNAISGLGATGVYNYSQATKDFALNQSMCDTSNPNSEIEYAYNSNGPYVYTSLMLTADTCYKMFEDTGLKYLYLVNSIDNALEFKNNSSNATKIYDNGTIEYMKTLKKYTENNGLKSEIRYLIGVFYKNGQYYYASIMV